MTDGPRDQPKAIAAWCLYDWGNSAFTTLVVTFIYSYYFTQAISPGELGTLQWSNAVSISAVLIAVLSPIMGAIADKGGRRKRYLALTTIVSVIATVALTFVRPDTPNAVLLSLGAFVVANVGFELGIVFYNAFLPVIASPGRIGRISGLGWGVGYIGGLVCLVVALVAFVQPDVPWFGMTKEAGFNVRATNLLVAGWFAVFSLPLFLFVREAPAAAGTRVDVAGVFRDLLQTVRHIRQFGEVMKFLIAHLVYNDGLVTIWAFGAIYAGVTFGMPLDEVILFGIALNVVAGLGAFLFGFVDDRIGGKKTIMITLGALSMATVLAVWAPNKTWLWVAGILIGVFGGPNQAASRSLMARFVPARHQTEFFGFYSLSGKVTSFLGPMLLGWATVAFGTQRAGVATILIFFLAGAVVLGMVNERRGFAEAQG